MTRISSKIPRYGKCKVYNWESFSTGEYDNEIVNDIIEIAGKKINCRVIYPGIKFFLFAEDKRMIVGFYDYCLVEIIDESGEKKWIVFKKNS